MIIINRIMTNERDTEKEVSNSPDEEIRRLWSKRYREKN